MAPYAKSLREALKSVGASYITIRSKESGGFMFAVALVDDLNAAQEAQLLADTSVTVERDPWGERAEVRYYG